MIDGVYTMFLRALLSLSPTVEGVQTKGVPIEALMVTFDNHWFWKRYAPVRVAPSLALQEQKEEKEVELGEQGYA